MLDERIDADTLRFAVLGETLKHTWSPYIHNSLFSAAGRNAIYMPITIPKHQLSSAVDVLRSCFSGFNVTIPYKERIIPLLDEVDDAVKACGAVNTVENRNGRLIGHITDGIGLITALQRGGVCVDGVSSLILGAGGAARVIAYEMLSRGGSVAFAVRNLDKGLQLKGELSALHPEFEKRMAVCTLQNVIGSFDVLINCTPIGMYPNVNECPVSAEVIARCGAVFDAVYNPRETQLLKHAHEMEIPVVEGLGMLFYQAVEAQRYWFSDMPSDSDQSLIYAELLRRL